MTPPPPTTPPQRPRRATAPAGPSRWGVLAVAAAAGLVAGCGSAPPAPGGSAAPDGRAATSLRVIAFNDFHGHLESGSLSLTLNDPHRPGATLRAATGGAAALGGLVAALRQGAPHSVVVASGDMIGAAPLVSSLFRHESTVEVLNQIGVDVATAGNHEFDAGTDELQRVLKGGCAATRPDEPVQSCALGPRYGGARFQMVLANVQTAQGPLFAPAWVQSYGGIRVGFIGAVTRSTPSIVVPSGIAGLRFEDEAEAINRAAAALQAQGVRAMVAVIHEGGELGRVGGGGPVPDWNDPACPGFRGDIVDLARRITPQVDLILSAHTHQGYNCRVDGRPVMQAFAYGRGVSVADLVLDPATGDVDRGRTLSRNLPVLNDRTEPGVREALASAEPPALAAALRQAQALPAVAQTVAAYAAAAAPRAQRRVGQIGSGFDRGGKTDSAAGRLVADAQLAATRAPAQGGAQIALMNAGGIRADLPCRGAPPCAVTYGDVFTMQPFGNSLVVMTLTGAQLKALLEQQQTAGREAPSFLQPSSGFAYQWVAKAPPGERVQALQLNGQPIAPQAQLRVTVNSFLAEGGDGFTVLQRGRERLGGLQDIDALTAHLAAAAPQATAARIQWVD